MLRSKPKIVGTLGDTLVQRLALKDPAEASSAFDTVVDIAKKMDLSKQVSFVTQLMENELKLTTSPLFQEMTVAYHLYCTNESKAEDIREDYYHKKLELYKKAKLLKTGDLKKNRGDREHIDQKLKTLEKKFKRDMAELHNDTEKRAFKKALSACYAEIKNHLGKPIQWETQLRQLFAAPPGYPDNGFISPVLEVVGSNPKNVKAPSKLDIRKAFENNPQMDNYIFLGFKEGGANNPGQVGARYICCYQDKSGKIHSQIVFCKQATDDCLPNNRENISEILAGRLMNRMIGSNAASTYCAIRPGGTKGIADDIYVSSIYFDNLTDTHTAALLAAAVKQFDDENGHPPNEEEKNNLESQLKKRVYGTIAGKGKKSGQEIDDPSYGHPTFRPGTIELMNNPDIEQTSQGKSLMASLLVGNDQIHGENAGLADFPGDRANTVQRAYGVLDFGGAFRRPYKTRMGGIKTHEVGSGRFMPVVTPESTANKKYGVSYLLAYPPEVRFSKKFITGLDAVAEFNFRDLHDEIDKSVDYLIDYYGEAAFAEEFSAELDTNNNNLKDPAKVRNATKQFLSETLCMRQLSLREYSITSKLENIRMKTRDGKPPGLDFDINALAAQNPLYFIFERIPEMKDNGLSLLKAKDEYRYFNSYIRGSNGLDLNNINISNIKDRKITLLRLLLMLKRCHDFIDENDRLFCNTLMNSLNYFANNKDTALFSKACDEAYLLLRKTYKKVCDEGLFDSYFLTVLSQAEHKFPLEATPTINLSEPDELIAIFDEAKPSDAIKNFTRTIFENCDVETIMNELNTEGYDPNNLRDILQENENEPLLTPSKKLASWINLPANTQGGFRDFISQFYEKLPTLIFDDTSNFQPWLVQALGYKALKKALQELGNNQVKIQLFNTLKNFLKNTLRNYAEDKPQLAAFMEFADQLLDHQDHLLNQFFEQLTQLQSNTIRFPQPLNTEFSAIITDASENLQTLLNNPVGDIHQFTEDIHGRRSAFIDKALDLREENRIKSEVVYLDSSNTSPDTVRSCHVSFIKQNVKIDIEVTHRTDPSDDNAPISDLTKIDDQHLNIAAILEQEAKIKFPGFDFFKDSQEFFWATINEMRQTDGMITQQGLFTALKNVLEKGLDDKTIEEMAKKLFTTYQNSTEQLDPDDQGNYFPNDVFIRMALYQVEAYINLTGQPNPPIIISDAWDPHYAEALALVCSWKKCPYGNESGWKINVDNNKAAAFEKFYKSRFNDPNHKITYSISTSTKATVSTNPSHFYSKPPTIVSPGVGSGSTPSPSP